MSMLFLIPRSTNMILGWLEALNFPLVWVCNLCWADDLSRVLVSVFLSLSFFPFLPFFAGLMRVWRINQADTLVAGLVITRSGLLKPTCSVAPCQMVQSSMREWSSSLQCSQLCFPKFQNDFLWTWFSVNFSELLNLPVDWVVSCSFGC